MAEERGPGVRSPCVSVCALDQDDVCTGCYRTAREITDWFMADDVTKRQILERSRARRDASTTIRLL
jgi:predicted Fe-S protein YdhL (DUF1289 family)